MDRTYITGVQLLTNVFRDFVNAHKQKYSTDVMQLNEF